MAGAATTFKRAGGGAAAVGVAAAAAAEDAGQRSVSNQMVRTYIHRRVKDSVWSFKLGFFLEQYLGPNK